MSSVKKRIEELDLMDDFLFTEATTDPETAPLLLKMIIERAVGLKVEKLIIEPQKTVNGVDTDSHGIRMDVTAREVTDIDGKTIRLFDVEPNNIKEVHLPKRSRYYQALADVKLLETGLDYDKLPDMWTIWILPYDPFGLDYRVYTVKNVVEESPKIEYNDGIRKLFLYTGGKKGGTKALKDMLAYIQNTTEENAVDEDLKKLHMNVKRLKNNKQIGVKYMHMQEVIKYAVKAEVKEILEQKMKEVEQQMKEVEQQMKEVERQMKEVEQQMSAAEQKVDEAEKKADAVKRLTQILLDEKRYDDLRRITTDEEYFEKLMVAYNIGF